eukprot:25716-Pelagomonas_calceolata.AAC.5
MDIWSRKCICPASPVWRGCAFPGWCAGPDLNSAFDMLRVGQFSMPTLYAHTYNKRELANRRYGGSWSGRHVCPVSPVGRGRARLWRAGTHALF